MKLRDLTKDRTRRWIRYAVDSFSLLLVCVTVAVWIGWMIDSDRKQDRIQTLQRKISRLERSQMLAEETPPTADAEVTKMAGASSVARVTPVKATITRSKPIRLINVADYVNQVKSLSDESGLESLDYQADNLPEVIQPLIECCQDPEHGTIAVEALKRISAEHENTAAVAEELYAIIETYRYAIDDRSKQACKAAYWGLIALNPENEFDMRPLIGIMNDDLSPWSAYACIAVKVLEPETNIGNRMARLLKSKYRFNRLVCARTILDYVDSEFARDALQEVRALEEDVEVRNAIIASLNQVKRELADASSL